MSASVSVEQALRKIAEKERVSVDDMRSEMEKAIKEALNNPSPEAREFWESVPCLGDTPTPEEVIVFLVEKANE